MFRFDLPCINPFVYRALRHTKGVSEVLWKNSQQKSGHLQNPALKKTLKNFSTTNRSNRTNYFLEQ